MMSLRWFTPFAHALAQARKEKERPEKANHE